MCKFTKHEKSNGSLNGWTEDFCYLELDTKIKVVILGFVYIFNACADLNFPAELYDVQFGPNYLSEIKGSVSTTSQVFLLAHCPLSQTPAILQLCNFLNIYYHQQSHHHH